MFINKVSVLAVAAAVPQLVKGDGHDKKMKKMKSGGNAGLDAAFQNGDVAGVYAYCKKNDPDYATPEAWKPVWDLLEIQRMNKWESKATLICLSKLATKAGKDAEKAAADGSADSNADGVRPEVAKGAKEFVEAHPCRSLVDGLKAALSSEDSTKLFFNTAVKDNCPVLFKYYQSWEKKGYIADAFANEVVLDPSRSPDAPWAKGVIAASKETDVEGVAKWCAANDPNFKTDAGAMREWGSLLAAADIDQLNEAQAKASVECIATLAEKAGQDADKAKADGTANASLDGVDPQVAKAVKNYVKTYPCTSFVDALKAASSSEDVQNLFYETAIYDNCPALYKMFQPSGGNTAGSGDDSNMEVHLNDMYQKHKHSHQDSGEDHYSDDPYPSTDGDHIDDDDDSEHSWN